MFIFSADITKERVFFLVLVYVFNFDLHVYKEIRNPCNSFLMVKMASSMELRGLQNWKLISSFCDESP